MYWWRGNRREVTRNSESRAIAALRFDLVTLVIGDVHYLLRLAPIFDATRRVGMDASPFCMFDNQDETWYAAAAHCPCLISAKRRRCRKGDPLR